MKKILSAGICCTAIAAGATAADKGWKLPPETVKLERGAGVELVTAQCIICHSVDYISTQPRMSRAAWTASVNKMRDKYGAPVATNQIAQVVDYLVKFYGDERSPSPKR